MRSACLKRNAITQSVHGLLIIYHEATFEMQSSTRSGKVGTKIPSIIRSRGVAGPRKLRDTKASKFSPKRESLTEDKCEEIIEKLGRDLHLGLRWNDGEKFEDRPTIGQGKQLNILPSSIGFIPVSSPGHIDVY